MLLSRNLSIQAILRWPGRKFPPYPAGSGQIINRNALFVLGSQMQRTPITSIDDAFVGICMLYAGFEHRLFDYEGFMYDGLLDDNKICSVVKSLSIHYPKFDYECMVNKINVYAERCDREGELDISASCNWYDMSFSPPNIDGPMFQRCGAQFNNSRCSTNRPFDPNENGPCCSQKGYCGRTGRDCSCPDCVDFLELENCKKISALFIIILINHES